MALEAQIDCFLFSKILKLKTLIFSQSFRENRVQPQRNPISSATSTKEAKMQEEIPLNFSLQHPIIKFSLKRIYELVISQNRARNSDFIENRNHLFSLKHRRHFSSKHEKIKLSPVDDFLTFRRPVKVPTKQNEGFVVFKLFDVSDESRCSDFIMSMVFDVVDIVKMNDMQTPFFFHFLRK